MICSISDREFPLDVRRGHLLLERRKRMIVERTAMIEKMKLSFRVVALDDVGERWTLNRRAARDVGEPVPGIARIKVGDCKVVVSRSRLVPHRPETLLAHRAIADVKIFFAREPQHAVGGKLAHVVPVPRKAIDFRPWQGVGPVAKLAGRTG